MRVEIEVDADELGTLTVEIASYERTLDQDPRPIVSELLDDAVAKVERALELTGPVVRLEPTQ
jgi:hypothetical protein